MGRKLRAGIMGAGWPGRRHADAISKIAGVEVAAISDIDLEARDKFVERFGKMESIENYHDMLKMGELDFIINCLPTGMHYTSVMEILNAGFNVMCEKPPTTTAVEMKKIKALAERKGLTYGFCRQPRFKAETLAVRKMAMAGKFGRVYHAESSWIRARGVPMRESFTSKAKGGGVLLDLGVHMIDNAWFAMGSPKPAAAFAGMHCGFAHIAPKGLDYSADDCTTGMVQFENGATLQFTVTFALNTAGREAKDAKGNCNPEWSDVKIYGDKAGADVWAGKMVRGNRKDVTVSPIKIPARPVEPFEAQMRDYAKALRAGTEPTNSASHAVMLMEMLDALKKSAEIRKSVTIR